MIMEEINKSINKQVGKYIPSQIGQVLIDGALVKFAFNNGRKYWKFYLVR